MAILFAGLLLLAPTIFSLIPALTVLWVGNGIATLLVFVRSWRHDCKWLWLMEGTISLQAAYLLTTEEHRSALLYYIALTAIVSGLNRIALAVQLRRELQHEWLLALSGVLAFTSGWFLAWNPQIKQETLCLFLGVYHLCVGLLMLQLGRRLRYLNPSVLSKTMSDLTINSD